MCCCLKFGPPLPKATQYNGYSYENRPTTRSVHEIQPAQISMHETCVQTFIGTKLHDEPRVDEECVEETVKDDDLLSFYTAHSSIEAIIADTRIYEKRAAPSTGVVESPVSKMLPAVFESVRVPCTDKDFEEVRTCWFGDIRPDFSPWIEDDPVLSPVDTDRMLLRFLQAERNQKSANPVKTTIARLRETAQWRADYRCIDFHRKGMARRMLMHKTNPGASIYFGDYGLRDHSGEPVLVGRSSLMTDHKAPFRKAADKMIACTHLRAAIFILDRAAVETKVGGSYILDVGSYPKDEMISKSRYWDADGFQDCSYVIKQRKAPIASVGPHLPHHESMADGLPVLKESMRMAQTYYPGLLKHIYFYRPSFMFRTIFAIFSMWVPQDVRDKFVLVKEGEEHLYFQAPDMCTAADLPPEFGGHGPPLDGDGFLSRAVERYDSMATLPEV